jgi:hypothetical protein
MNAGVNNMLANNNQRWDIWVSTGKTLDYNVFASACLAAGVMPQDALTFSRLVGLALVSHATLGGADLEAYKTFAENSVELSNNYRPVKIVPEQVVTSCCGGGKVR